VIDRIRTAQREESGFTLIELLVVVIIIGILAAIAIPVFLSQRESARNSAVQSDLRNAATAQETYFTENSTYASNQGELETVGFRNSSDVAFSVNSSSSTTYCMDANHTADPPATEWYFDSDAGAPQEGTC
jgi:type IV pilus assembly protein PilA